MPRGSTHQGRVLPSPSSHGTVSPLLLQGCCEGKGAATELEHPMNTLGAGLSPCRAHRAASILSPKRTHARLRSRAGPIALAGVQ